MLVKGATGGQFMEIMWKLSWRFSWSECLNWHEWEIWKSSLRSIDAGALIHCIMCFLDKNSNAWKHTHTRRFNHKAKICQNAALPLNGMHLSIPSSECWTFVRPQAAQPQPGWALRMLGHSLLGQSSRYLAMVTRPILTKFFKAWDMIVVLIPVYDILISSRSRHKSASNWHALNYWLT